MSLLTDLVNLDLSDNTEKIIAEYIWVGGSGMDMRSKARTLPGPVTDPSKLPKWNYDGSSTGQAPGEDSEVILYPQAIFKDPFRRGNNILVMCDTYTPAGEPIPTNKRHAAAQIFSNPDVVAEVPWYGIEQEYTLLQKDVNWPVGWPIGGFPGPQGPYYCSVGADKSFGRDIVDAHYKACLYAGINISGINGEVMPGQWEFQVGPSVGISAADEVWIARFILERITEIAGVVVSFDPKPIPGDWNGAGAHTNYSTKSMREEGGYEIIKKAIDKLGLRHKEHISADFHIFPEMAMAGDSSNNNFRDFDGELDGKSHRKVGLVYDETMCKHDTPNGEDHPECPDRIRVIWEKLQLAGVSQRCVVLGGSKAEDKHLQLVHTKDHVSLVKSLSTKKKDYRRNRIASQWNSIYLNGSSSEAAFLAAGSVVELAEKVAEGELDCGYAIVRPPGHHAEPDEAMGFCLFNNVAVAASYLLDERPELGVKKILIVDWDVHHGNGTQKMFWKDPRVLFFSVHRHEHGGFYPAGDDGDYNMVGEGPGEGFNINVPWEQGRCGDADYLAAWDHILIPVAKEFNPDIILLSAGFDAAIGDPLGGCRVTPYGYSVMLKKLMEFAQGKIVLALEGGYNLDSIAKSSLACVQVLLEDKPIQGSSEAYPFESTWRVIQAVRKKLSAYWPSLADVLSSNLIDQKTPTPIIVFSSSDSETEDYADDILDQMSRLNIENHHVDTASTSWRRDLSKVDVWYASFGSNMWKPRFLCYIQGGQVEGMKKVCVGSMDKTPPKQIMWESFPHRLFFGRESSVTWGVGGVAFINPLSDLNDRTHMCLYRITLEQFNDVLFQENGLKVDSDSPLFDLDTLQLVEKKGSTPLASGGWYGDIVCLGKEGDIPILTMTCTLSAFEKFKSGEIPLRPPSEAYVNTMVRGLVEGGRLSEEEAKAYIDNAASKPL